MWPLAPRSEKCVFPHNTMAPVSLFPRINDSSKIKVLLSSYFATLYLLLSWAYPSSLVSGCNSTRHSMLHTRPKIQIRRGGAFWSVKKTFPETPESLMPRWPKLHHMTVPKPVIGKVSGPDMIGLTSPESHPQRDWRNCQAFLKILATPYLKQNKNSTATIAASVLIG